MKAITKSQIDELCLFLYDHSEIATFEKCVGLAGAVLTWQQEQAARDSGWVSIKHAPKDGSKMLLGVFKDGKWYETLGRYNVNTGRFTLVPTGFRDHERARYFHIIPPPPAEEK